MLLQALSVSTHASVNFARASNRGTWTNIATHEKLCLSALQCNDDRSTCSNKSSHPCLSWIDRGESSRLIKKFRPVFVAGIVFFHKMKERECYFYCLAFQFVRLLIDSTNNNQTNQKLVQSIALVKRKLTAGEFLL